MLWPEGRSERRMVKEAEAGIARLFRWRLTQTMRLAVAKTATEFFKML